MANLPADLLAILRCPVTGSTLIQQGDELISTGKDASGNQLVYPIEDGIPVLLRPELRGPATTPEA